MGTTSPSSSISPSAQANQQLDPQQPTFLQIAYAIQPEEDSSEMHPREAEIVELVVSDIDSDIAQVCSGFFMEAVEGVYRVFGVFC